jgi:hypothetical protein
MIAYGLNYLDAKETLIYSKYFLFKNILK